MGKQKPPEDPPDPPWPPGEAGCGLEPEDAGEAEGFELAGLIDAGATGASAGPWLTPCGVYSNRHANATTTITGKAPMTNGNALSAYTLNHFILLVRTRIALEAYRRTLTIFSNTRLASAAFQRHPIMGRHELVEVEVLVVVEVVVEVVDEVVVELVVEVPEIVVEIVDVEGELDEVDWLEVDEVVWLDEVEVLDEMEVELDEDALPKVVLLEVEEL